MVASLLYLLFRRVLAVAVLRLRSREFKELEIVVLRHELAVLRRQISHPRLDESDHVFLAAASRLLGRASRRSFFVRPDTLLAASDVAFSIAFVPRCVGAAATLDVARFDDDAGVVARHPVQPAEQSFRLCRAAEQTKVISE